MMKRDWLLFSFVLSQLVPLTFAPASADTGWVQQSCPVSTDLTGVDFVDRDNGWICGVSGTILHTTDGGQTWVQQDLGSTWDVTDIDFVDLDNGYAVGALSTIWRTTDGGETWTVIYHAEQTPRKSSVFVVDPSTVWVTGYSEEPGGPIASICVTTSAGAVWECGFVTADHGTTACDVTGFSAQTAFISCNIRRYDNSMYSVLYKTADACESFEGVTWLSAPQQEVQFLGERIGFYGPRWEVPGGDMKTTTDGGATWTSRFLSGDVLPAHMAFASATLGWLAGMDGYIAMTTDGGATWVQQATGTNRGLYKIQFVDASVGTAVGEAGMILHTITGGMSGADVAGDPSSASLCGLFAQPNPSTGPVLIAYGSPVTGPARIEIFDVHGRAVRELTLPSVEGRRQEILWDGRDASGHLAAPGAYFIRLTVDGATTATHRITLTR